MKRKVNKNAWIISLPALLEPSKQALNQLNNRSGKLFNEKNKNVSWTTGVLFEHKFYSFITQSSLHRNETFSNYLIKKKCSPKIIYRLVDYQLHWAFNFIIATVDLSINMTNILIYMQIALLSSVIKCWANSSLLNAKGEVNGNWSFKWCRIECTINLANESFTRSKKIDFDNPSWEWSHLYQIFKLLVCVSLWMICVDSSDKQKSFGSDITSRAMSNFSWRQTQINATFPAPGHTQYWGKIFLNQSQQKIRRVCSARKIRFLSSFLNVSHK